MTRKKQAESSEEIVAIIATAGEARERLYRDFDQLMEEYTNQWVAVSKDGLVAHHDEVEGLIALYRAAGYASHQVELEFMDPLPQVL